MSHSNTPPVRNRAPLTARSSSLRCVSAAEHQTAEQYSKTGRTKPRKHPPRSALSWNTHQDFRTKRPWPLLGSSSNYQRTIKKKDVVTASLESENIPRKGKESNRCDIEKSKFIKMQKEDITLEKPSGKIKYVTEDQVKYRVIENNQGKSHVKQLIIPKKLRQKVMEIAHYSKFSRHQGIKKTQDRVKACFYWPGRDADVQRYCKSCGVYQRTIHEGRCGAPAPLGKIPLIDTNFKQGLIK